MSASSKHLSPRPWDLECRKSPDAVFRNQCISQEIARFDGRGATNILLDQVCTCLRKKEKKLTCTARIPHRYLLLQFVLMRGATSLPFVFSPGRICGSSHLIHFLPNTVALADYGMDIYGGTWMLSVPVAWAPRSDIYMLSKKMLIYRVSGKHTWVCWNRGVIRHRKRVCRIRMGS